MKIIDYTQGNSVLNEETKLGIVHLMVKNLEEQVRFYTLALKMTLLEKTDDYAILGDTKNPLLKLHKNINAKRYHNTTGMYHFALLYPNEAELAKAIYWLFEIKYENHPTDHGFSKTTYLKDLEGNDIELYIRTVDRAIYIEQNGQFKIKYTKTGLVTDGRDTLDLDELFSNIKKDDDIQSKLVDMQMGHVHLYGSNVNEMLKFYTDVIGFAEGIFMPSFQMADVGISKEINHVVAFNAWKRTNVHAPKDALGLIYYTLVLNNESDYHNLLLRLSNNQSEVTINDEGTFVKDPSGILIKIEVV